MIWLLIAIVHAQSLNFSCPTYQCLQTTHMRSLDSSTYCLLAHTTTIPIVFSANSCPANTYCTIGANADNYYCNSAPNAFNLSYPGEMCNTTNNCIGGATCQSNVCKGLLSSQSCSSDVQCDVDLFCSPVTNKCSPLGAYNSSCSIMQPCQSHLYCDSYSLTCLLKGTLDNFRNTPTRWACKNFFAIKSEGKLQCWSPPAFAEDTNNSMTTKPCTIGGSDCRYIISNSVEYYKDCRCGYTANLTNSGYCPIAEGALSNNISVLQTYIQSNPRCHILAQLVCFSQANWNNSNFKTAWITMQNLQNIELYQNNPDCVKNGLNQLYTLMSAGNYVPPVINNTNSTSIVDFGVGALMMGMMLLI
jgi:hypothetical protein